MQFHGDSYKYIKPHPFRAVWFILHMTSALPSTSCNINRTVLKDAV